MALKCRTKNCNNRRVPGKVICPDCLEWVNEELYELNKSKKKHCPNCGQFMTANICNSERCLDRRGKTISKGSKMEMKLPKGKKLWVTIATLLIPILNAIFGWGISLEALLGMFGVSGSFNLGQGYADGQSNGKTSSSAK